MGNNIRQIVSNTFQFCIYIYIYILHKCKGSKDANKLLTGDSKQIEFDKEKSTMHFFYEDEMGSNKTFIA